MHSSCFLAEFHFEIRDFQRFQLETAGNAVRCVSLISCWLFPSDVLLFIRYLTWLEEDGLSHPLLSLTKEDKHGDKEFPHGTKLASRYWYDSSCFFSKGYQLISARLGNATELQPTIGGLFTLVIALMNLVTGLALVNHFIISYWIWITLIDVRKRHQVTSQSSPSSPPLFNACRSSTIWRSRSLAPCRSARWFADSWQAHRARLGEALGSDDKLQACYKSMRSEKSDMFIDW